MLPDHCEYASGWQPWHVCGSSSCSRVSRVAVGVAEFEQAASASNARRASFTSTAAEVIDLPFDAEEEDGRVARPRCRDRRKRDRPYAGHEEIQRLHSIGAVGV